MGRLDGTQIGADGKRHPIGEGPTDPSPFRVKHRSLDVAGAARDIEAERAADIDAGMAAGKARLAEMAKPDLSTEASRQELDAQAAEDHARLAEATEQIAKAAVIELPDEITLPPSEVRAIGAAAALLADSGHAQEAMHQVIRDLAEIEEEPTEVEPVPEGEITLTDTTEELPAGPVATALGDDYSDYDNDQEETPDAP